MDFFTPALFGRPFVKRFALCYLTDSIGRTYAIGLSVTLMYCDQMVGWIKMKLGMEVGLGPGHIVLDGDLATPLPKKRGHSPQFSAHVYCGETVAHLSYC